jgi:hypothetical protein
MSHLIAATPLGLPLGLVAHWSSRSHDQARRNAMAACALLAERRRERLEVEAVVAACLARREVRPGAEPEVALG